MEEKLKRCSGCKQLKPMTEFNNMKRARDGKQAQCKVCQNARLAKRLQTLRDLKPSKIQPETIRKVKKVNKFVANLKEADCIQDAYYALGTTKSKRSASASASSFLKGINKDKDVMEHFLSILKNEDELSDFFEYFRDARETGDLSDRRDALKLKAKILGLGSETTKIIDDRQQKPEELDKKLEQIDNIIEAKAFKVKEGTDD